MTRKDEAPQVNPIVAKAAAQVRASKSKDRRRKLPEVGRWDCDGQLSLFADEEKDR
ncbi:hypothetical protein [Nocardia wallacei]|uniref:Uncharacterized protein n=1 Tax=Nocardia wallacei TaxID=480035 RepID=A0A7G1KHJ4_9NOCA|nr:hypothetical protein [Nocardia wallacei]BCK53996.1 hypothetical protein NWFMUON74_17680 [Nocardia wallacei]